MFVHVDFKKLDIDTLKTKTIKIGENLLKTLGFDAKSQWATLRDLETELEKLDSLIRPGFETITKKLGIQELAVICDENLSKEGIDFVIVAYCAAAKRDQLNTSALLLLPHYLHL